MAGLAGDAIRVIGRVHLREAFWLGSGRGVTTRAEDGCIGLRRSDRCGIVGMFCESPVTGLAVYMRVLPFAFGIGYIAVAGFAGFVAGELYRMSGDVCDGVAAVVAVLTEAFGNDIASDDEKDDEGQNKEPREAEQMPCILKDVHASAVS